MALRWTEDDEAAFRKAAASRPLFGKKTPGLRAIFEANAARASCGFLEPIIEIRYVAWEIYHYRKLIGPNGRISLVGKLFAETEAFFDLHRYELFAWPSTWGSGGHSKHIERRPDSPFSRAGYRVGEQGLDERPRRVLLSHLYGAPASDPMFDASEREAWGAATTATRLYRMALHLAGLLRAAARRATPPSTAIAHWRSDLEWLKTTYYDGRYSAWRWPHD